MGLAACSTTAPTGGPTPSVGDPTIDAGLYYTAAHGPHQRLDACLPKGASAPRPVIVAVHGGSFKTGSKASTGMRYICERFARAGYDTFSVDYRLLPSHHYPDALRDVQAAIRWLREPAQVKRFDLDPTRLGAFGESAGAVLVSENATGGSGSRTSGTRVEAVVALSTAADFQLDPKSVPASTVQLALEYLGCATLSDCPAAKAASAVAHVDSSDPPFLLAASTHDWIPVAGTELFASELKRAGVPVQTTIEQGSEHGLQLINGSLTSAILAFYAKYV